ncbi:MAG: CCA tRNA nucleotidyltransferase [Nitrospirota bacterium]|nr:MAG: CCA tRNA nucleotidyltransferase [Nitrospirota bacterium]
MGHVKVQIQDPAIQEALVTISKVVATEGGKALLVGGCVRDTLLRSFPRDYDVEVYGIPPAKLVEILSRCFSVSLVGEAFGVIKIQGFPIDVSLPRRESKRGEGHRGFEVFSDAEMTPQEAASRRDFTINAMAIDPLTRELLDPFGGLQDLEQRMLRHTSLKFGEDPLRVLRGLQLVGRFELTPDAETVDLAYNLFKEYETLPIERIWAEWHKWAAQSTHPSLGLMWLKQTQWIQGYPELVALEGCPQDTRWHPEGDVWTHTLLVTDEAARIAARDSLSMEDRGVLVLAALCHDLGKPTTTRVSPDGVSSRGHPKTKDIYVQFLERIGTPPKLVERVVALCLYHLTHIDFAGSHRHVRRLALSLSSSGETIEMLCRLVEADNSGRPPLPKGLPDRMKHMELMAKELKVEGAAPQPVLLGRHLLDMGFHPGPQMGEILKSAFEAQLDGRFETLESAKEWVLKEGFRK